VGILQQQGAVNVQTAAFLRSLSPTADDIALMLLDPTTQSVSPAEGAVLPDVDPLRESYTETFELGFTGVLRDRVAVSAVVYRMTKNDFVSPLLVQTPLVLLNGPDVGEFLVQRGVNPQQAAALAAGVARIPLAVVSSDAVQSESAELVLTYRNIGDVTLWGSDLSVQAFLTDEWTASASYSYADKDYFRIPEGDPIALNAPRHKGSVGLAYRNLSAGLSASARVRMNSSFPAESAGFVGTRCITRGTGGIFEEDCVDAFVIADLTAGYQIPNTRATLQVAVNNVLDTPYRSFVGVPAVGRFAVVRMKYDLF
jgi:iron complex outermembrane receptor protein